MNNIIKQIRAEIERQRKEIRLTNTGEMKVADTPTQLEQGWLNALSWMEKVLDTLQEPINPTIEKLRVLIKTQIRREELNFASLGGGGQTMNIGALEWVLKQLDTLKEQPVMIQWTGNNLKEVIEFTGKSPRFDEWFKTWDEYESYVHSHDDIFKLFNEDGTHLEVPVGAWIFKTPDGQNIPSTFVRQEQSVCKDVEEAAKAYADDINSNECLYTYTDFTDAFKAGAKWQREQMLNKAVEGKIRPLDEEIWVEKDSLKGFEDGDKVGIIIVKKD